MYNLLCETGYCDISGQISEEKIYAELVANPDIADDWLQYSADKRCNDGWYFRAENNDNYVVGCIGNCNKGELEFADILKACAHYIKVEIDDINDK